VEDLALAARIKAALSSFDHRIQIRAESGQIFVGHVEQLPQSEWAKIKAIAERVEGVQSVHMKSVVAREQHDHINPFHNIG
jgi:hypothetical protein